MGFFGQLRHRTRVTTLYGNHSWPGGHAEIALHLTFPSLYPSRDGVLAGWKVQAGSPGAR
jgi:hypothetical protein